MKKSGVSNRGSILPEVGDSDYFLDENFEVTFDGGAYEWGAERVFSEGLCYVEKIKDAFPRRRSRRD